MTIWLFLLAFNPGERLVYSAKYGFLNIGRMILEVKDTVTYEGQKCYRITSALASNPKLTFLFSLNDTVETIMTQDRLLSLWSAEKIHEGKYAIQNRIRFDQVQQVAVYDETLTVSTLPDTRELLSFWYFLRTQSLTGEETLSVNVHKSRKNYAIKCLISEGGWIKTGAGEYGTILVTPQTKDKGIFGSQGGMEIWYSDDSLRYPVKIKTTMKYGKIIFKLEEVKN
jgi:hypothetical protein